MEDKEKIKILRQAVQWAIDDMKTLPRSWGYNITSIPRMLEALEATGRDRRICSDCKRSMPISEFYLRSDKTGPRGACKECHRKNVRQYQEDNPDKRRLWDRARKRKRNEPKEKYSARQAVFRAINAGELSRPSSCELCGAGGVIEGHHEDYSKQLEVIWLCKRCHYNQHNKPLVDQGQKGV